MSFLSFLLFSAPSSLALSCQSFLEASGVADLRVLDKQAFALMMKKSFYTSGRRKDQSARSLVPESVTDIAAVSESNFNSAVHLVLSEQGDMPLSLETAIRLNKILTKGLVGEAEWGNPDYRTRSFSFKKATPFTSSNREFYVWLEGSEAKTLLKNDPIRLAELAFYTITVLDAFPDGNTRLARMFADLILIKGGKAPALHGSLKEFLEYGDPRSDVTRDKVENQFRERVAAGQARWHQIRNSPNLDWQNFQRQFLN